MMMMMMMKMREILNKIQIQQTTNLIVSSLCLLILQHQLQEDPQESPENPTGCKSMWCQHKWPLHLINQNGCREQNICKTLWLVAHLHWTKTSWQQLLWISFLVSNILFVYVLNLCRISYAKCYIYPGMARTPFFHQGENVTESSLCIICV